MYRDIAFYQELVENMSDGVYFVDRDRRITYWNQGAARLTGFSAAEVVGRTCRSGVLNHVDSAGTPLCQDRCPLKAIMADGESRETHVWMNHKDGARRPVWVRAAPIRDEMGNIIGAVEVFSDDTATVDTHTRLNELERLAMVDQLTGLGNRRYLEARLTSQCEKRTRYGLPCGILFIDIDHFKNVNDTYGHEVGDKALALVARTLSHALAGSSIATRYGGEEFVVLEPEADLVSLTATAERLRAMVATSRMMAGGHRVKLAISLGGILLAKEEDPEAALARADSCLYAAKTAGRNRVVMG